MVYIETLKKYSNEVESAVDELFTQAFQNQKYDTDLLIVLIHGFYQGSFPEFFEKNKLSPYTFGPDYAGLSLDTFYEFFHSYRTSAISRKAFHVKLKQKKNKTQAEHIERIYVNLELLIYLKFWESDFLLRQMYNLANLASGKYYEWDFQIVRQRQSLIRNKIQAPLTTICPKFYALIEDCYSAEIRNSIAHSKYYFTGRNIHLANDEKSLKKTHNHSESLELNVHLPAQEYLPKSITHITFDDWEIRFHKVLLIFNFIIGNSKKYSKYYQHEVADKHFGLPLSTPKLSRNGLRKNQWVKYDPMFNRWLWSTQINN